MELCETASPGYFVDPCLAWIWPETYLVDLSSRVEKTDGNFGNTSERNERYEWQDD